MKNYKVVQIGASFSKSDIKGLENLLNTYAQEGYHFHSVMQVEKTGCPLFASKGIVYLAIFVRD